MKLKCHISNVKKDSPGSYTVTDILGRNWCVYKNMDLVGSEKWIAYMINESGWFSDPMLTKKEAYSFIKSQVNNTLK